VTVRFAWVLVALGLLAPAPASGRPVPRTTPPNIVLILTDDQRWDSMWAMPTVESDLVGSGVEFSNAFVVNSLCCPSRSSILTGQYSHSTGVYTNEGANGGFGSFDDQSTVATWLHGAGYRTALMGKYLNGYSGTYVPPGWDRWFAFHTTSDQGGTYYDYDVTDDGNEVSYGHDPSDYSTDVIAGQADSFIRSTDSGDPLFLYWASSAPHIPAVPADRYSTAFSDLPTYRPPNYNEDDVSDKPAYIQALPRMTTAQQTSEDELRIDQYRSLLAVDDGVSTILTALADTGRLANTMVVFMSDNGFSWGEHRRFKTKMLPYEENIRVPMVIRYDPLTTTSTNDRLAANIDLAPTFAELAGVPAPGVEGQSLLPLLSDPGSPWRKSFLVEHLQTWDKVTTYCQVRETNVSYVAYGTGEEELYDLLADPFQLQNVVKDPDYGATLDHERRVVRRLCVPPPPGFSLDATPPAVALTEEPADPTGETEATFAFDADQEGVTFVCSLDGDPTTTCTSPATYTSLAVGSHIFSVLGTNADGFVGATSWDWTVATPVSVQDFSFTPSSPQIGPGTVLWSFEGPSTHTVTDASGLALFDSGPESVGASYPFTFTSAGTYNYHCSIHPRRMRGTIAVTPSVEPTSGDQTTTFVVTWASSPPPPGQLADVQVMRPGSSRWEAWRGAQSGTSAAFLPDQGSGTYSFRARLRAADGTATTRYSPAVSITVT
jgi:N-acetylglucosamine-6-sulfatase